MYVCVCVSSTSKIYWHTIEEPSMFIHIVIVVEVMIENPLYALLLDTTRLKNPVSIHIKSPGPEQWRN